MANCGCTDSVPCGTQECGCKFEVDAGCIRYTGDALTGLNSLGGDRLSDILLQLNDKFNNLVEGNYIEVGKEPIGANCANGGVKIVVKNISTASIISTEYICTVNTLVSGLNTDNSDPSNPIIKISVDGTTITGLGTPASPLISTYSYTLPIASSSTLGGIKVGTGLSIDGSGVLSTVPVPSFDEVVNFDKVTPTTSGVVFSPNIPAVTNILYVSSVDATTWIWTGTEYITTPTVSNTEWNFLGTSVDAGANKTLPISRDHSIYTLGYDSYFNDVRVGRGGGNNASNTVLGLNAGRFNTTGSNNTYLGANSGAYNTGNSNVFIGRSSGQIGTNINYSVFIGHAAGLQTTVDNNTFIGYYSGGNNTIGVDNTFVGYQSGKGNTTANYNTFIGKDSGFTNTIGYGNSAIGYNSFYLNQIGNFNTAHGVSALHDNTIGSNNTATGINSGQANTGGNYNTFTGTNSGFSNTLGNSNSFNGALSGYLNSTGEFNTFLGSGSGYSNSIGNSNTFVGTSSGYSNSIGSDNSFLGVNSGAYIANGVTALTIANRSVFLGKNTKALANNQTNQIIIGYNAIGKGSNTVQLGDTDITDTYIQGTPHINNTWTLPIAAPTTGQVLGYSAPGVSSWITAGGITGSGEQDFVARWTPNSTTLGKGKIRDNGSTVGINTAPLSYSMLDIMGQNGDGVSAEGASVHTSNYQTVAGVRGLCRSVNTFGLNIGISGQAEGNQNQNIGGYFVAGSATAGTNYGVIAIGQVGASNVGIFASTSTGANNYSSQFIDGTQGIGKVLACMTADGKARWNKVTSSHTTGFNGSFTSSGGQTITVTNGLITNIV